MTDLDALQGIEAAVVNSLKCGWNGSVLHKTMVEKWQENGDESSC